MDNVRVGEHTKCLDLLQVVCSPGTEKPFSDCAILLEVWNAGGLLQTNLAIPEGAVIAIGSIGVQGQVVSCQRDEFGFIVEIGVCDSQWFPAGYVPPYILQESANSAGA
jgi:hypothetical protein